MRRESVAPVPQGAAGDVVSVTHAMPRTHRRSAALFLSLGLLLAAGGCRHSVYPPPKPRDAVKVYLADYGWHSGLLLPLPDETGRFTNDGRYIDFTFGDFDYMVNNREGLADSVGAILLSPQAGLGRRVITVRGDRVAPEVRMPPRRIDSFYASAAQVSRLTQRLERRFQRNASTAVLNPKEGAVYVKDDERYWLANNCNHTARRWLTALGCEVRGSVITVGFALAGGQVDPREKTQTLVTSPQARAQENRNESIVATPSPPSKTR